MAVSDEINWRAIAFGGWWTGTDALDWRAVATRGWWTTAVADTSVRSPAVVGKYRIVPDGQNARMIRRAFEGLLVAANELYDRRFEIRDNFPSNPLQDKPVWRSDLGIGYIYDTTSGWIDFTSAGGGGTVVTAHFLFEDDIRFEFQNGIEFLFEDA